MQPFSQIWKKYRVALRGSKTGLVLTLVAKRMVFKDLFIVTLRKGRQSIGCRSLPLSAEAPPVRLGISEDLSSTRLIPSHGTSQGPIILPKTVAGLRLRLVRVTPEGPWNGETMYR